MLTEVIIYISLFSLLFSSAFMAAFQSLDVVQYLNQKKDAAVAQNFLTRQLDGLVNSDPGWATVFDGTLQSELLTIANGSSSPITFGNFSAQVLTTSTSSEKVLEISFISNNENYIFYYVQEK